MSKDNETLNRTWHNNFVKYTEFIVNHPNYKGLFWERGKDGRVKWVVTGKSVDGTKRRQWWDKKCKEYGIPIEAGCYAKIAVLLHPTKQHVCQICGKSLSIEYVYPNKRVLTNLNRLLNVDIEPYTLSIFDIVEKYGKSEKNINAIKQSFHLENVNVSKSELANYIFLNCRTLLSPGVMSNSPDRLDGFHSDGNCCRSKSDKGRHSDNLQRYTQDRRVYETWADGNWKMADRLMAEFSNHGISADHIGPISLGFCHRPKFQPMTKSENSSKNNRMRYSDVLQLLDDEKNGETVISWHSKYIWDGLKNKVNCDEDAIKLSSLMRANLHHILIALSMIYENGYKEFLLKLLHPNYSYYDYTFEGFNPQDGTYKGYTQKRLTGKNQQNNAERYIRIAFESLEKYQEKDNRRQFGWNDSGIDSQLKKVLYYLNRNDEKTALDELNIMFKMLANKAIKQW